MRIPYPIVLALLLLCSQVDGQTIVNEGPVSGTWNVMGSPYQVYGEIHVPEDQLLTIEAGVSVHFQGHYRFFVRGTLMALGTVQDSIYFTVESDTVQWCGIEFQNPVSRVSRSLLEYCVIEHSFAYSGLSWPFTSNYDYGGGIMAEHGNLTIRNCAIRNNKALIGSGIKTKLNTVIENTSFTNNESTQKDIVLIEEGVQMSGCLIAGNNTPNCIVRVWLDALFLNNTVSGNRVDPAGQALAVLHGNPDLVNSIFYGNNATTIHVTGGSNPLILCCNIEGGKGSIFAYHPNYKGEFAGIYESNIDCPPAFLDAENHNYELGPHSPCIDKGTSENWNTHLTSDILGLPRNADNTGRRVDIGAYEYQGDPLNRAPYIQDTTSIYKLSLHDRKVRIPYYDADTWDQHNYSVGTDHDSLDASMMSADNMGIDVRLSTPPGWSGSCNLRVKIWDNSGTVNDTAWASIPAHVGKKYRGRIEFDESFSDTVKVIGDIFVEDAGRLNVEEGTFIQFQDHYKLAVYGQIQALGSENKRICFDIVDSIAAMIDEHGNSCGWGGIEMFHLYPLSPISLRYCDFLNTGYNRDFNKEGGTLTLVECRNILLDHCRFESNQCVYNGERNAGIKMENCFGIQIRNSEFTEGIASGTYTGTYIWGINSDFVVDSCLIHNTPLQGTSAIQTNGGNISVSNSEFCNNQIKMLEIGTREDDFCIIENNYFHDNIGGSIDCEDGNTIRNNMFLRTFPGNAVINCRGDSDIMGNFFAYNDNQAYNVGNFMGIAMWLEGGLANVINNTIVKNYNRARGATIYAQYASPYIANNILWDNDKEGISWYNGAGQVTPPTIENNVIKGGYTGNSSNFEWDPYFRLNDSLDYQLTDSSRSINRAITDAVVFKKLAQLDLAGNSRYDTVFHQLDIGAYEFQGPFEIEDSLTRIPPARKQIELDIYPNPVSEALIVETEYDIFKYSISNLKGVKVKSGFSADRIYVGNLPEGQYILSVSTDSGITRKIFIKL
jgi:hypothetical protein